MQTVPLNLKVVFLILFAKMHFMYYCIPHRRGSKPGLQLRTLMKGTQQMVYFASFSLLLLDQNQICSHKRKSL